MVFVILCNFTVFPFYYIFANSIYCTYVSCNVETGTSNALVYCIKAIFCQKEIVKLYKFFVKLIQTKVYVYVRL